MSDLPRTVEEIIEEVRGEVRRQERKWSPNPRGLSMERWLVIIGEEYGECCEAVLDPRPPEALLEELVQVAACCVSAIVDLCAQMGEWGAGSTDSQP